MPKRRACRKKVVNYRLSDSENEEEFSRKKVQLKSNSQQNSNKSVKYYISSDSESEDERKRNTQKRNRTSSSQDVVEASGSNEDNSMDRAFTLASSAIIAEVNTLLATTREAFTKWRERKVQEEEIKTPETNQVIDLTNSNDVKKPKKEETPILVGDDDSNTDKLKDPTVQNADEENSNGLECPICLESLRNKRAMLTPCGHYFCADCIKIHLSSNKNCPTCRKKCTVKRLYPFYM